MIERHQNISFAGGALVFPGGRIDNGDYDPDWKPHLHSASSDDALRAAQIAAIREAFEETGILLAKERNGAYVTDARSQALNGLREAVEQDDRLFLELIKQEELKLACDDLVLFAHWAPPEEARHKRFDTLFFAAQSPADQIAREDGNEATDAFWITPAAAIEARDRGKRKMIFPTSRNIELLNQSTCVADVINFAQKRPIRRVVPEVKIRNGEKVLTIPDDLGYPVTEEPLAKAFRI